MKIMTIDGNEACSHTAYMFTEVAGIYPITPSSPMAEHLDEWSNEGRANLFNNKVKVVQMQSEAGAAGMIHGSLQSGSLTTTFTASQGLLLMIPNMYKIAGELLPGVIHVAARSISTHALSIFGDHQDIYATRMTGFCMLASSSVQDAAYLSAVTHLSAIKASLPFLHFFDGFRTSHELQKISVLEKDDLKPLIDWDSLNSFRKRSLNPFNPETKGTAQNDDVYFQATEARNKYYDNAVSVVTEYMDKINKIAKTDYKPFNYYGDEKASNIIVAMGSVCETIKETIDYLNANNYKVGLIEVHLYRPFSTKHLFDVLPSGVKNIAVLDRTKEPGSNGEPLYLDIVNALKNKNLNIVGGRYGLSSKNTTPADIKAVYDMLENPINNFTISIDDDVTNTSLKADYDFKISEAKEFLIYGFGSDGMVSAAKSIIKLMGDHTDNYVQGYFQHDSKKSGGVTTGHLRFKETPIRSTYYVENPSLVVVTKDSYLDQFEVLGKVKANGVFILNTIRTKEEILNSLDDKLKQVIKDKNIKFYIINAFELARKVGLKNKISTIMESVIIKLSGIIDYELAKDVMKKSVKERFSKVSDEIVKANYDAIDEALNYIEEVILPDEFLLVEEEKRSNNIIDVMNKRQGDHLPTSAFVNNPDGSYQGGTTDTREKQEITDIVPKWINSNCIQCNLCSFVCPHGVIRPFLLDEDEYNKAPDIVKQMCLKPLEPNLKNYYYAIGVSVKDCTGCGLCIKSCPGKKGEKALIKELITNEMHMAEVSDYLFNHVSFKKEVNLKTVKGSQFKMPKFFYHGACAGCGEPAYIKLLTQLYGDNIIIANATGCSSIYGGSLPDLPYTVPWASSLFEDNAEYGFGIAIGNNNIRNSIKNIMENNLDNENKELFEKWLNNSDDYEVTKEVYDNLNYDVCPKELSDLKDYIPFRTIWMIGGDGWAYDIGFGGIDHVLASNENVNILVLDTQVYSNTGGQSSKASPKGSIASFTASGKIGNKKDLARIALAYPHVYVASVSLGANPNQLMKVIMEANNYHGPSLIIAYSPCIAHGITGGMENSIQSQIDATKSGYFPIFHYHPEDKFYLDSKADFDLYDDYLTSQTRYRMLKNVNPEAADRLIKENKANAMKRYEFYQSLAEK